MRLSDVQIINKPEPRKVEHLSDEEKLERQVRDVRVWVSDIMYLHHITLPCD